LLTGVMVLIFAAACGCALSGAATALAAMAGIPEGAIAVIAVATLLAGFASAIGVGLRDLADLARRGVASPPARWVVGSIAVMFVAGPFWNLCVVHVQEPISGSDLVRTVFDDVLYALVLTLVMPLGAGVPWMLARLRRQTPLNVLKLP
jgi:hypothetical protein